MLNTFVDAFRHISLAPRLRRPPAQAGGAFTFTGATRTICGEPDPSQVTGTLLCNFDHEHGGRHSWEPC
jgi:hypothetical protein